MNGRIIIMIGIGIASVGLCLLVKGTKFSDFGWAIGWVTGIIFGVVWRP